LTYFASWERRPLVLEPLEARVVLAVQIQITHIPDYGGGDGTMTGMVTGIDPANYASYVVAPYIQIEGLGWYTKPTFATPTVPLKSDGTFSADVFTGGIDDRATIFAAAVVPAGDTPPAASGSSRIPANLNPVAITSVQRFDTTIQFAGMTWGVKEAPVRVGPGSAPNTNYFSNNPGDVYVDNQGLHLSVHNHDGVWWATEVVLLDSLGYGTYSYQTTSSLSNLDPNLTFGAFTWDSYGDDPGVDTQREIDFEDGRWGNAGNQTNAQEVVQPYQVTGNLHRYSIPNATDPSLTRFFTWTPNSIQFVALQGLQNISGYPASSVIDQLNYTTDSSSGHYVPTKGREQFRFNFWINNGGAPSNGQPADVVISNFAFKPLLAATGTSVTATEGAQFSGSTVATFTDADPSAVAGDFAATIDWGDGTSTAGTVTTSAGSGFAVKGSHAYGEEGTQVVTVTVHDNSGSVATSTGSAMVADATLAATGVAVSATAGVQFSNTVATFTDADTNAAATDFKASIDWGDGTTTAGAVTTAASGGFTVSGSHAYAGGGTQSVKITIADVGGSTATAISAAAVVGSPHERYVTGVYQDVLCRAPDPAGLAFWTRQLDSGAPISSIAAAIDKSAEYYATFVVGPDYVNFLGRQGDEAGVQYWTKRMQSGLTDQQVEGQFAASDEFFKTAGGNANQVNWIDTVYKLLLGRTADPGGEKYWNGQLTTLLQGEDAIDARLQVALGIAGSQENNTNLINDDYFHYLGRSADPGGLAYWLQQFAAGATNEDVIAGFTGSAEYYKVKTGANP
jgi:hypothetical protein